MLDNLQHLIGSHIAEDKVQESDWLEQWPVVNRNGIIQSILQTDDFDAADVTLIDWVDGKLVIVDGSMGFDAVLEGGL